MADKQILKEKLSLEVPEMRKTRMMEQLFSDELNENFTDLDFDEIRAIAFYNAVHSNIIELPAVKALLDKHMSLKRSLDRKGRQEAVAILKRPVQYVPQYPYPGAEQQTFGGRLSKLKSIFERRRKMEEVDER